MSESFLSAMKLVFGFGYIGCSLWLVIWPVALVSVRLSPTVEVVLSSLVCLLAVWCCSVFILYPVALVWCRCVSFLWGGGGSYCGSIFVGCCCVYACNGSCCVSMRYCSWRFFMGCCCVYAGVTARIFRQYRFSGRNIHAGENIPRKTLASRNFPTQWKYS